MRTSAQCAIGSNLVSDAPRTVIWPVARSERQKSTQPRRSKAWFRFLEAVVHEVGVPTTERSIRPVPANAVVLDSGRDAGEALSTSISALHGFARRPAQGNPAQSQGRDTERRQAMAGSGDRQRTGTLWSRLAP